MTSADSMVRNPAPHRGFNAKAREVLLDPEPPINRYGLNRAGSDDEFRRKLTGLRLIRTDSEATNTSHSSTQSEAIVHGKIGASLDKIIRFLF
jgi:hypothetical protein